MAEACSEFYDICWLHWKVLIYLETDMKMYLRECVQKIVI